MKKLTSAWLCFQVIPTKVKEVVKLAINLALFLRLQRKEAWVQVTVLPRREFRLAHFCQMYDDIARQTLWTKISQITIKTNKSLKTQPYVLTT